MAERKSKEQQDTVPSGLYRSEENRIVAGVAGGLGEYFGIDPTIIRVIFVLLTVFGGSGLLIYLILWLIMPAKSRIGSSPAASVRDSVEELRNQAQRFAHDIRNRSGSDDQRQMWGTVILIFGFILLLGNFGFFSIFSMHDFWPVLLIILGLLILFKK